MTVSLPLGVKTAFEQKYAEKAGPTLAALMQVMLEGEVMIISETDVQRLSEHLGSRPTSSGELVGMAYSMKLQIQEQKDIADSAGRDLKAYESMSPGRVVVDLGTLLGEAQQRAQNDSLPLKLWVETKLKTAIENNWF
jgi:hypothetical protein